jgi:hypothetical protein
VHSSTGTSARQRRLRRSHRPRSASSGRSTMLSTTQASSQSNPSRTIPPTIFMLSSPPTWKDSSLSPSLRSSRCCRRAPMAA